MHVNGQTFSVVLEHFFYSKVFGLKMQKSTFLRKNGFERSLKKNEVHVFTNWSIRLEKHETIEILLMVDFYAFLKVFHFSKIIKIFEIYP